MINSLVECCLDHLISFYQLSSSSLGVKSTPTSPPTRSENSESFSVIWKIAFINVQGEMICEYLLLNSLVWARNLEMPSLWLFFVGNLTECFKRKDYLKSQEKASSGKIFFWKNRWKEAFDCNLLFHVSALPWKSVLSLSFFFVLLSCFFCSHYPNIRPKKLTCSLQVTKMRVCEVLLIYTLCRSCPQYFFSTSIFRNGERLHLFIVPGVCASKPQNKWPDETRSFSSAYYIWFSVQQQIIQQSKN